MKKSKGFTLFKRLICPPRCACCRERLSPIASPDRINHGKICLCENCMQLWQRAKSELCHICYFTADKCDCEYDKMNFDQATLPSLCFYRPNEHKVQNKIIYLAKTRQEIELFEFLACELAPKLCELLDREGIPRDKLLLSFVPRNRAAFRERGFDQGEELCSHLARELGGAEVLSLFSRRGGDMQKRLDARKRKKNIDKSIFLSRNIPRLCRKRGVRGLSELLEDKCVVLVDDVVTTGATMSRAKALLDGAGAERVIITAVARGDKGAKVKK